jgi:hypothetical protein
LDYLPPELYQKIDEALNRRFKLLLIVGPHRIGKTRLLAALAEQKGWPAALNVSLELSEQLRPLSKKERSTKIDDIFKDITGRSPNEGLLLDNIEILFTPELEIRPLELLKSQARNRLVVSSWPGFYTNDSVRYASKQHREHCEEAVEDFSVLQLATS